MIPTFPDLYCKIFVRAHVPRGHLARELAIQVNGRLEQASMISSPLMELYVDDNDDCREEKWAGSGGFLYYPFAIDVDPASGASRSEYVSGIGSLLEKLWQKGYDAVAACEFEDELPTNPARLRA